MQPNEQATLVRICIGESDHLNGSPLHEVIMCKAYEFQCAGATSWKGLHGFGPTTYLRAAKFCDMTDEQPIIIEIVDLEVKVRAFLPTIDQLLADSNSGAIVTIEQVEVIRYRPGEKR